MRAIASAKGYAANMVKLQTLLYLAYGSYLAAYDRLLFDELPRAWKLGPAFPKIHSKVKAIASASLDDPMSAGIKEDITVTRLFNAVLEVCLDYPAEH